MMAAPLEDAGTAESALGAEASFAGAAGMVVGVGGSVVVVVVEVVVVVATTVVVVELVVTGVTGSVSPPWQAAATMAMRSRSLKRCTRRGYKSLRRVSEEDGTARMMGVTSADVSRVGSGPGRPLQDALAQAF